MEAFLTGSRAYGTPTEESDYDLVVLAPGIICSLLWKIRDEGYSSVRFGKLNLILFNSETELGRKKYSDWRWINSQLIFKRPVSREDAVIAFSAAELTPFYKEEETDGKE